MRNLNLFTLLVALLLVASGCDTVLDSSSGDGASAALDEAASARGGSATGAVYTVSDDPSGNAVLVFARAADGSLASAGAYDTDGLGSGTGLNGTSNPLELSGNGRFLFAVNGGSDEVTAFRVDGTSLVRVATVPSGGPFPVSLTIHRDLLYVLNAGANGTPGNITGFRIGQDGALSMIPGATQPLNPSGPVPTQIGFTPQGDVLVVTDRAMITTYVVDGSGVAGAPNPQASVGATPFGFGFTNRGVLLVSEAFGGQPDASATSSYRISRDGIISVISPSVGTTETAACWVEVTQNGRYAYTTNTASSSVSGYHVAADGTLTLFDDAGMTASTGAGSSPLDMAIAQNRYLYVHSAGTNEVRGFRIAGDGSLSPIAGIGGGLPATARGVAAR